jgi:hypothetical protein
MKTHAMLRSPGLSRPGISALMASVIIIALLGGLCHSAAFADTKRYKVPVDSSPQKGPKDAPVTIIEFLDFQ